MSVLALPLDVVGTVTAIVDVAGAERIAMVRTAADAELTLAYEASSAPCRLTRGQRVHVHVEPGTISITPFPPDDPVGATRQ